MREPLCLERKTQCLQAFSHFAGQKKQGFGTAPITVQNGPFLARTHNTKIGPRHKPLQEELTLVDAFLRLKRWAMFFRPGGLKSRLTLRDSNNRGRQVR